MSIARRLAYQAFVRYEKARGPLRPILEETFRRRADFPPRERAFCRELLYGAVQRLNTLDWALDRFARTPVGKLDAAVRCALRLGAYQILFMPDRVPPYAAVNETVELLKRGGRRPRISFANALLRSLERNKSSLPWPDARQDRARALAIKFSHPEWLVRRWLERWGADETAELLRTNNEPPPFAVRVNALKTTRGELRSRLRSRGVKTEISTVSLDGLRFREPPPLEDLAGFREGEFMVQDEASQLAVHVLDPQPGETVLDLCAAPGGKASHIAERMRNQGRVLAFDLNAKRLDLLRETCGRMGSAIVEPGILDERQNDGEPVDRALVDAPCSGLGILRRRPDIRWNKDYQRVLRELPPLQGRLLDRAARRLKPDGVLLYATCTTEPEENQEAVRLFLAQHPEFTVEPAAPWVPPAAADAVTPEGYVQLFPHRHDTDGFFIARLRKEAS